MRPAAHAGRPGGHARRRHAFRVRMLGELRSVDHAKVEIGMQVHATYIDFPVGEDGPAWTLYAWEPDA